MEWTEVKSRKRQKVKDVSDDSEDEKLNPKTDKKPSNGHRRLSDKGPGEAVKPIIASSSFEVVRNLCNSLSLISKPTFKVRSNSSVSIICEKLCDKKKIIEALKCKQIHFHTFTEPSEKSPVFVLKGFYDTTNEALTKILEDSGVEVLKVSTLFRNQNHNLFLVAFKSSKVNCAMLNHVHRYVDSVAVKWETYKNKSKSPVQCHNCQRWGHTASNCGYPYRCIKCTETHAIGACSRTDSSQGDPKCCNCQGNHAANFKGCPVSKKFSDRSNINKMKVNTTKKTVQLRLESERSFPFLPSSSRLKSSPIHSQPTQLPTYASKINSHNNVSVDLNSNESDLATKLNLARNNLGKIPNISQTVDLFVKLVDELATCESHEARLIILMKYCVPSPKYGA